MVLSTWNSTVCIDPVGSDSPVCWKIVKVLGLKEEKMIESTEERSVGVTSNF